MIVRVGERMLVFSEIKVFDRNSEHFGVPALRLMENAGRGAFEALKERMDPKGKTICILAGKGNNGGDGVVLARYLAEDSKVTLVLAYPESEGSELSRANYSKIPKAVKVVVSPSNDVLADILEESRMIIDALLGIGIRSEPREPLFGIIETMNRVCEEAEAYAGKEKKIEISLDVPTGMGTSVAVRPEMTLTFHDSKVGMTEENCGEIVIVDIGIPKKATTHVGPGDFVHFRENDPHSHKGQNGIVMVVGGGPYVGAPVLASLAALRSGADLVHLFVPRSIYFQASSFSPEIIVHPIGQSGGSDHLGVESVLELTEFSKGCHSAVIGPGLGRHQDTWKAVGRFINGVDIPLVMDADAIYTIKHRMYILSGKSIVLTPHQGEFRELMDISAFPDDTNALSEMVRRKAREIGVTVLLKGMIDVITDGHQVRLNDAGHPAMTTGGTGDVLSGITGALLARGMDPFRSARLSAFICGTAGERAGCEKSFGMVASDVVDRIPDVLREYLV